MNEIFFEWMRSFVKKKIKKNNIAEKKCVRDLNFSTKSYLNMDIFFIFFSKKGSKNFKNFWKKIAIFRKFSRKREKRKAAQCRHTTGECRHTTGECNFLNIFKNSSKYRKIYEDFWKVSKFFWRISKRLWKIWRKKSCRIIEKNYIKKYPPFPVFLSLISKTGFWRKNFSNKKTGFIVKWYQFFQ